MPQRQNRPRRIPVRANCRVFATLLSRFKSGHLRILLNAVWPAAYDGLEAQTGFRPPSPAIRTWWSPEQSTTSRRPLVYGTLSSSDVRPVARRRRLKLPRARRTMFIRRDYSDKSPARQARRRNTDVHSGTFAAASQAGPPFDQRPAERLAALRPARRLARSRPTATATASSSSRPAKATATS